MTKYILPIFVVLFLSLGLSVRVKNVRSTEDCTGSISRSYYTYDCLRNPTTHIYECVGTQHTDTSSCKWRDGYCAACDTEGQYCSDGTTTTMCGIGGGGDSLCGGVGFISTSECCVTTCGDDECGSDGCGGSCGWCASGTYCEYGNCVPNCVCTAPAAPVINSPSQTFSNYNGLLTLSANSISSWGEECSGGSGKTYRMCWGTNSTDPCSGAITIKYNLLLPTADVTLNSLGTFYWKYQAVNACGILGPSSAIGTVINNGLAKTCNISTANGLSLVNGVYVGTTGTSFDVSMSGNANSSTSNTLRLWVEDPNEVQIADSSTVFNPLTQVWTNGTVYTYRYVNSDLISTNNYVSNTTTNMQISRSGNYNIYCDISFDPNKCTGVPKCVFNGGSLPCDGWASCSGPANARGGDNLELCITNEGCASQCGQARGCGLANCANIDSGVPGTPTIVSPNGTSLAPTPYVTTTSNIVLTWLPVNITLTDEYVVNVYTSAGALVDTATVSGANTSTYNLNVSTYNKTEIYYWQVTARNIDCGIQSGPVSDSGYFKFINVPVFDINNFLIISGDGNNTTIPRETNGNNHTCQIGVAYAQYFPHSVGVEGGDVNFEVIASDSDGGDDIVGIEMRFNSVVHPMTLAVPVGNNRGATLNIKFDSTELIPDAKEIDIRVTDASGLTTGWIPTTRFLKVWNCEVPTSGKMYDSSSVSNPLCLTAVGFSVTADVTMNFTSVGITQVTPNVNTTVSVNPPPDSYTVTPSGTFYWGREYLVRPNSNLAASSNILYRWVDVGVGVSTVNCSNQIQGRLDNSTINPYSNAPELHVDMTALADQSPWYQVAGGGVMSKTSSIRGFVPPTCQYDLLGTCKPAIAINYDSVGSVNNGLLAASTIRNDSGCSISSSGPCYGGLPNDWRINSNVVSNDVYNYDYFYQNYNVNNGVGVVLTGDKTMSQLIADPIGGTGVVLISGDLDIDVDNSVATDKYLMIVVTGDINIQDTVNNTQAIFVAGGNFTAGGVSASDTVLKIKGVVYTYSDSGEVVLSRGFNTKSKNNYEPAVEVNYWPDFVFSIPSNLSKIITDWRVIK